LLKLDYGCITTIYLRNEFSTNEWIFILEAWSRHGKWNKKVISVAKGDDKGEKSLEA
jgi:hypothetical protein